MLIRVTLFNGLEFLFSITQVIDLRQGRIIYMTWPKNIGTSSEQLLQLNINTQQKTIGTIFLGWPLSAGR